MQSRRSDKGLLQVVFLVDVNPTKWTEENEVKVAARALRLCVLKILRYSADRLCERLSDLKWGFKFFSSNALLRDYGRHGFKDFKVESFEEFELQINRKFEDEFEKSKETQQQQPNEQVGDEGFEIVDSLTPLPAKCLTCSLTELVHDFEWDKPDICSPVKRSRSQTDSREDTRNIVFLLSNSPCGEETMKVFTGVHVKTPESFRSAVVPPALIRQFKDKCRISLFWIDIGMLDQKQRVQQDESCQFIVQGFVKEMGGALIPISSLLFLGDEMNNLSQDITAVLPDNLESGEMTGPAGSLAIPFSSAMDYYMDQQTDNHSCTYSPLLQHVDNADLWSGWLCTSGCERRLCCGVNLNPLFSHTTKGHDSGRPTSTNNLEEKDAAVISFGISKMVENSNEATECGESRKQEKSDTKEKRISAGDYSQQGTQDVCLTITLEGSESQNPSLSEAEGITQTTTHPNLLWIGGVVERNAVCPSWLHPTRAYSVIGMTHRDSDEQRVAALSTQPSGQVLSGWFQELLLALARENLLMMLEFCDPITKFPVTGLLQSLTSVCGVLSVINSDMLIMVEKLLLLQGRRMVPAARTLEFTREDFPQELRLAKDKCAELKTRPLEYGEVHCNVNAKCIGRNQEEGVKAVGHFSSGNLEMWHTQLDCSASVSSVWKHLECSKDEEEEEEGLKESALMRELKKLYSTKKRTPSCGDSCQTKRDQSPNQLHAKVKQLEQISSVRPAVDSAHSKEHIDAALQEKRRTSQSECTRDGPADERCDEGNKADQIESVDFKDKEEMSSFLTEKYAKLLSEDSELLSGVKEMTAVISHFMVKCFPGNEVKNSTAQFIRDGFLAQNEILKVKYQQQNEPSVKIQRIREYKLQILLRLEVGLLVQDESRDVLIDEVTVMLRAISFLTDAAFLGSFMRDVVVQGYGGQIPKLLCAVYEGLMQEPPRELLSPSHVPTEDISPLRRMSVKASSILRQDSEQPRSGGGGGRVLTRHMSVSDVGGKRREIVVPGNVKVKLPQKKEKQRTQHNEKNAPEGSKGGKQKAVPGGQKTPVKKVRRNLFTEGGSANGPDTASRPKQRKDRTRHSVAGSASKIVQDTPARKQLPNALWQQQHRARKRSCTATEVKVVMESPLRDVQAGENVPRRSPRRSSGAVFQRSRSFYGRSASSRPLTRTKSFTAVGSRQSPGNLTSEPGDRSLDSQDATSPAHFSQSLKKRFALHSLLSSVCSSDAQKGKNKSGTPPPNTKKTAVRSSPRLMKKRSFSCIGFSTTVPLGTTSSPLKTREIVKSQMNSADGEVFAGIITTPEKARLLSPVRQSPRLKKRQQKSSETEIVEDKPRKYNTSVENSLVTAVSSTNKRSSESSDGALGNLGDERHMQQIPENEPVKEQWQSGVKVSRSTTLTSAKKSPSDGRRGTSRLRSHGQSHMMEINQPNVNASLTTIPKSFPSDSSGTSCSPNLRDRRPLNRTPTKEAVEGRGEVHANVETPHKSVKKTPSKGGRGSSTVSTSLCTPDSTKKSPTQGRNLEDFDPEDIAVQLAPVDGEIVPTKGKQQDGLSCASECVDTTNDHIAIPEQTPSARVVSTYEEQVCRSSIRENTRAASQARPQDNQIPGHLSEDKDVSVVLADLLKSPKVSSSCRSPRKVCDIPQSSPVRSPQLLLLRDRPATPTLQLKRTKKRAGSVTGSPVEAERLSPLNQILKQRKRKRDDVSKDAVSSESPLRDVKGVLQTSHREKSHKRETAEKTTKPNTAALELASSRTSSDENDWFSEIENELDKAASLSGKKKPSCGHNEGESSRTTAPPRKKRRINKSKVFGTSGVSGGNPRGSTKRLTIPSSLSNDILAFEEDNLKGSPVHRRSKNKQISKTPISAISLKMLQESPILCNESLLGSTQEFGGSPVSGQEHQKRRHFPRAVDSKLMDNKDSLDVSAAGFQANSTEGVKLRKRLKLGTS